MIWYPRKLDLSEKMSYFWRARTPNPVKISESCSLEKINAALQHLKPTIIALDPDSICLELIIYNCFES